MTHEYRDALDHIDYWSQHKEMMDPSTRADYGKALDYVLLHMFENQEIEEESKAATA